jgi:hypothetical protein
MPEHVLPDLRTDLQLRYEILGELGRGSTATVYRARHRASGREVAVKVLSGGDGGNGAGDDGRSAVPPVVLDLYHPNIVRSLESGRTDAGHAYVVFDLVPGETLRELLRREGALRPSEAIHLMGQVLDALAAAHARDIVHRDLKPENVLITHTGGRRNAVVLDFGLALLGGGAHHGGDRTRDGATVSGTPSYAAPEQLRGETATAASDLYSWGLTFIECMTGTAPIRAVSGRQAVAEQLSASAVRLPESVAGTALGRLLGGVTAKDPGRRSDSAVDVLGQLQRLRPIVAVDAGRTTADWRRVTVMACRAELPGCDGPVGRSRAAAQRLCDDVRTRLASLASGSGRVVSAIDDEMIVVWGLDGAGEHDAAVAVEAALAFTSRVDAVGVADVVWRVGVHTGYVLHDVLLRSEADAYPLLGSTLGVASRIAQQAASATVITSEDTVALLRGEWTTRAAGELSEASSSERPIALSEVVGRRGAGEHGDAETSPLIGRAEQLGRATEHWARARTGEPCILGIRGEPGIGKSRLVRELHRTIEDARWLEARCEPEARSTPLHPVSVLLRSLGVSAETLAERCEVERATAVALLSPLLGSASAESAETPAFTPDRRKQLTLELLASMLVGLGCEEPTVLVVEDLQWADPTTVELVDMLVRRIESIVARRPTDSVRLLVLTTARTEFMEPWQVAAGSLIDMPRLSESEVVSLLESAQHGESRLDAGMVGRIVETCDGVPLFVEELARMLAEDAGDEDRAEKARERAIPGSLRDLLGARIDALSSSTRSAAWIASALGREFQRDVFAAVARMSAPAVEESLAELIDSGLVLKPQGVEGAPYRFKHALVRDAAYEMIEADERRAIHLRIGCTLRDRFRHIRIEDPALLAWHFELGGDHAASAEFWHEAGAAALARASYLEAREVLERGVASLEHVPASRERTARELGLMTALGTAHVSTVGLGATETRRAFGRASQICNELGREAPLQVAGAVFGAALCNALEEETEAILPHFRRLAERTDDAHASFCGHQVLAVHACWRGRYADSREHSSAGMSLYRRGSVRDVSWEFGFGLYCYAYGMVAEYHLGFAERAEQIRLEMLRMAERSGNPYSLAVVLGWSTTLTHDTRRPEETAALARRLRAIADEQHLYLWSAFSRCGESSALLQQGHAEQALAPMRETLGVLDAVGFRCSYSYYLAYLVEILTALEQYEEAFARVNEGLTLCEQLWTRYHEPELFRLRGRLHEATGADGAAEADYRRAAEIARGDGGASIAMRCMTDLAALLGRTGRAVEGATLLAAARDGVPEGHAVADYVRASAVLERLGSGG